MAGKKNTTVTAASGKDYGYFRFTRTVGHRWEGGKKIPIKKQFIGTSKANAEAKYKAFLEEQARGEEEHLIGRTFGELAEDYTYNVLVKSAYAFGTKRRYEQSYRVHVKDSWLASMPIDEVKARTIQDFYQGLDVSKQNLGAIQKWFAAFYKYLSLNEISENVLPAVVLPEKPDTSKRNEIMVWEDDELHTILSSCGSHRLRLMMYVMSYAGLRISECLGLKYSDFRDGFIHVDRQLYQGHESKPKHGSYRQVPIHPEVQAALEKHKERFKAEARRNGYKTDYVFTSDSGQPLEYGNVRRALVRYYKKIGVPPKNPHVYRSTFCTSLCRSGVPLEVASKLMGHKSVEVTAKHYALIKQDVQVAAINNLPTI